MCSNQAEACVQFQEHDPINGPQSALPIVALPTCSAVELRYFVRTLGCVICAGLKNFVKLNQKCILLHTANLSAIFSQSFKCYICVHRSPVLSSTSTYLNNVIEL
jgi:hypothetical protein